MWAHFREMRDNALTAQNNRLLVKNHHPRQGLSPQSRRKRPPGVTLHPSLRAATEAFCLGSLLSHQNNALIAIFHHLAKGLSPQSP